MSIILISQGDVGWFVIYDYLVSSMNNFAGYFGARINTSKHCSPRIQMMIYFEKIQNFLHTVNMKVFGVSSLN